MPFPTSPNDGDFYQNENGTVFVYDATDNKWSIYGATGAVIGPLEFEAIFDSDYRTYTQIYTWSGNGELTGVKYYTTGDTGTEVYDVGFYWTTGLLTTKTISGLGLTMQVDYSWDVDQNLERKDRNFI